MNPRYLLTDGSFLYYADESNNLLSRLQLSGNYVATMAGSAGFGGYVDGPGTTARLGSPRRLTTDGVKVYFVDG